MIFWHRKGVVQVSSRLRMHMDSTWDNDEVDILKGETQTKK